MTRTSMVAVTHSHTSGTVVGGTVVGGRDVDGSVVDGRVVPGRVMVVPGKQATAR